MAENKIRYSDEELEEFRLLINEKLVLARKDYRTMMDQIANVDDADADDTPACLS